MEGNWARSASAPAHRLFAKGDIGFWTLITAPRFGEIDIIAEKKPYIIFVEVKTRGPQAIASPMEAVTPIKRQRVMRTASLYLASHPCALQPRFDVMEVEADACGRVREIRHMENAFDAQDYR